MGIGLEEVEDRNCEGIRGRNQKAGRATAKQVQKTQDRLMGVGIQNSV